MTRRDHQLIADTLAAGRVTANLTDLQLEDLALAFAKELHRASGYTPNGNKSFRADVFVTAATGEVSEYSRRVVEGL